MSGKVGEQADVEVLLKALSSGDPQRAWEAFLDSYSDLIFHALSILDRDPDNRSDSFLYTCRQLHRRRFRRLRQFRVGGPAHFSTWLRAVVRNLYIDWRRHRFGRKVSVSPLSLDHSSVPGGESHGERLADDLPDPETIVLLRERRSQLAAALEKLDKPELRILRLRFEDGLTLKQISRVFGLGSPQSARYRLQKILEKLKMDLDLG